MFLPWKLLFRFFSALVLLATGGFAAGHDIPLPFTSPPPATAPSSTTTTTAPPTTTTTAPPATDGSTTTTTAPDASTTTTTAPDSAPPVLVTPVTGPAPTTPVTTTPTTAPGATPAPVTPSDMPPVIPVDGDVGAVCAAAATPTCGPAEPAPSPDDSHAARVQRCQAWWNSLAAAFTANNEPQWAAKASDIAGRCDAMITQWEHLEQQWAQHHPAPLGDHNGDGHPDNGKGPKGNHPAPPVQPPGKQVSRHGEGRH